MLAESDTHLVSLTAVLMFRVTPVMSDEPQQTLQAERERERASGRGSGGVTGRVHGRDASDRRHHSSWHLAAVWVTAAGCGD